MLMYVFRTFDILSVLFDPGKAFGMKTFQVRIGESKNFCHKVLCVVAGQHLEHELRARRRTDLDVQRSFSGIDLASGK